MGQFVPAGYHSVPVLAHLAVIYMKEAKMEGFDASFDFKRRAKAFRPSSAANSASAKGRATSQAVNGSAAVPKIFWPKGEYTMVSCKPTATNMPTSSSRLVNIPREKRETRGLRQTKPLATCITMIAVR